MVLKRFFLNFFQVKKIGVMIKSVPGAPKLHYFQDSKSAYVLCPLSSACFLLLKKLQQTILKIRIYSRLNKSKGFNDLNICKLEFLREKVNPWWKLSYKLFEGKYAYDPLLDISPFFLINSFGWSSWWYPTSCYSCW